MTLNHEQLSGNQITAICVSIQHNTGFPTEENLLNAADRIVSTLISMSLSAYSKTHHVIPEIFSRESIQPMQQWIPANSMREWHKTVRFSDLKNEAFG